MGSSCFLASPSIGTMSTLDFGLNTDLYPWPETDPTESETRTTAVRKWSTVRHSCLLLIPMHATRPYIGRFGHSNSTRQSQTPELGH